jgi:hypothetical protein
VSSLGEKTGAGYGVEELKGTSTMDESDLKRKVPKN